MSIFSTALRVGAAAAVSAALLVPAATASAAPVPARELQRCHIPVAPLARVADKPLYGCPDPGDPDPGTPTPSPPPSDYTFAPAALPWDAGALSLCIGGAHCGGTRGIVVNTAGRYVTQVSVYAHDNLWDKHQASLRLYADGVMVGPPRDVLARGGWITWYVYRPVGSMKLMTSDPGGGWSDEALVQALHVYP